MNDSAAWSLSRRGFLTGAAGVAAGAATAAVAPSWTRAQAAARAPAVLAARTAGATITSPSYRNATDAVDAANIFDGYVGPSLALTIQKFYATEAILARKQLTPAMRQLHRAGCTFLVDLKPPKTLTPSGRSRLSAWLSMLNKTGVKYRTVLYSEANNVAFATPREWFSYWSYYAPVVKDAGVTCGYNPGCGSWPLRALSFFPASPRPDELWMDYYCTGFRSSSRLDQLIALAHSHGVSGAGVAEWGWTAGPRPFDPVTLPWWDEYCNYLIHLADIGHINLGGIYFGSAVAGRTNNVINSPSDPRVLMLKRVSAAFAG